VLKHDQTRLHGCPASSTLQDSQNPFPLRELFIQFVSFNMVNKF